MRERETLAAKSAHNSLKRSRILYAVNPQSTFLPSVDPSILSASIARRKRRVQPHQQQNQHNAKSGSNALALISSDPTMNPPAGSTALISPTGANNTDNNTATGILVVRYVSPGVYFYISSSLLCDDFIFCFLLCCDLILRSLFLLTFLLLLEIQIH
jgi:hypothetical protein